MKIFIIVAVLALPGICYPGFLGTTASGAVKATHSIDIDC